MTEIPSTPAASGNEAASNKLFQVFPDIHSFAKAIKTTYGLTFDFKSLVELNTDFSQVTSQYMLVDIKEYGSPKPDNFLFLTDENVFICSDNAPNLAEVNAFEDVLEQSFGKSTIIAFLMINKVLDNHVAFIETFNKNIRILEENFDHEQYRALSLEFDRFSDRLEEFHNLIIGLQERRYKYIQTQYFPFDYRVLIAESQSLQARCRRRLSYIKDLRQDHEMKSTEELNQKIVRMNDILKKLTSITVILMLPTLIASHFGMNFANMPELRISWVYPAVIIVQFVIMGVFFFIFRKIGWL
jgi:Mg2+ and Co2+ transporter CorA